jgi:hypothetical protein
MNTLTTSLRALPNPALPRDLTAHVLARVEAIEQRPEPVSIDSGRSMWAIPVGSAVASAAVAVSVMSGDLPLFHAAPLSVGGIGVPSTVSAALSLLTGLALYALGLFAPLRHRGTLSP